MGRSYTTNQIGTLLKSAREQKGIRQNALAREVNIAAQTLSAYENGSKLPTLDNLMTLAEALDLSIDTLLGCRSPAAGRRAYTLGDFARIASVLLEGEECTLFRVLQQEEGEEVSRPALAITGQPKLERFLLGLKKMSELRSDGTIDKELFQQWISASLAELDRIPLGKVAQ